MAILCRAYIIGIVFFLDAMLLVNCFRTTRTSLNPLTRLFGSVAESTQYWAKEDEVFMRMALRQAQHAYRDNEVPIGAAVVQEGVVIATSRNMVDSLQDASTHAEMNALKSAAQYFNNWRLSDCTLYTTLEPCPMCFGALQAFRVKRVVYGAADKRLGACGSWVGLHEEHHPYHKQLVVQGGLLANESATMLRNFFKSRRLGNADENYLVFDQMYNRGVSSEQLVNQLK